MTTKKTNIKSDGQRERVAKQIVAHIKKMLKEQDCNVPTVKIKVWYTNTKTCVIEIGDTEWTNLSMYSTEYIGKQIKTIKDCTFDCDDFRFGNCCWDCVSVAKFPTTIMKFGKPCKEFNQLVKLVTKKYGINLKVSDLYVVRLFGKSGYYGEYGSRRYIAYSPSKCQQYIDLIKSFGRKKTACKIVKDDDIDTAYMEEYLTEGDGYRTMRLKIERA